MRPFVVVVPHIVFRCGERLSSKFGFVCEEEALYLAIGLWPVDSCQVVLDSKRIECYSEFCVVSAWLA